MPRQRRHRLTPVIFMVLSLLFSQFALAGYVCPRDTQSMETRMAAGEPCDGIDPDQPALCHQHMADPAKSFEAAKLPALGQPALLLVVELPASVATKPLQWHADASPERPPPEPLFLSTLRLRV